MAEKHFIGKVVCKALIFRDSKVLITRDVGDSDIWEIPGGRMNEGETPEEAVQREIFEELGVDVRVGRLVHTEQFHQKRDDATALLLAYEVFLDSRAVLRLDPKEIAEVKWIAGDEINKQDIYENCRHALEALIRA